MTKVTGWIGRLLLKGVQRVLFISSQPGGKVARDIQHKNVIHALKNAGVEFIAYTSFPDARNSISALASDHKLTESLITQTGIKHSFLRNNWYLEDEIAFLQMGADGHPAAYWANGKAGWALEREYVEAAAKVLVSDNPKEIYEFAGPLHTYDELGTALKQSTNKDFPVKQVSKADYIDLLAHGNLNKPTATMFASFQDPIQEGALGHPSHDLADVLGHPTLSLVDGIKEVLNK